VGLVIIEPKDRSERERERRGALVSGIPSPVTVAQRRGALGMRLREVKVLDHLDTGEGRGGGVSRRGRREKD
jgi:hypothetical protein